MHKNFRLRAVLDDLYNNYLTEFRSSPGTFFHSRKDPISFPHRYTGFHDREISGFLAATFAYGNVTSLCGFVDRFLRLLGPSPHQFLLGGDDAIATLAQHAPYYRLQKTEEILSFLSLLSRIYRHHGSLYELFLKSYDKNSIMQSNISSFVHELYGIHGREFPFLLPLPESGSPCKRLNLFFRWMVRRDGLDLGIWEKVSPAHLIIPLDTHIGRVSYKLGWITTPSLSWKKAEKVTEILRRFDPQDPIRFDFSLCHESISRSPRLKKLLN
jgi:uncharacterized protein (TIGR02757 family)